MWAGFKTNMTFHSAGAQIRVLTSISLFVINLFSRNLAWNKLLCVIYYLKEILSFRHLDLKNSDRLIKQIKEELLNQGRRDKESSAAKEESNRKRPSYYPPSSKEIEVSGSSVSVVSSSYTHSGVTSAVNATTTTPVATTTTPVATTTTGNTGGSSSYWIEEKIKLLKQIEEKDKKIGEL